jgi:hypothetical protein
MSSIVISPWRRKRGHKPRYGVYVGRELLGSIFESRGIFTAIAIDGDLIAASTTFQTAADALTTRAPSS